MRASPTTRSQSSVTQVVPFATASSMSLAAARPASHPTRSRLVRAASGARSAMAAKCTPGVRGIWARYMEPNFPAPISATRTGRPAAARARSFACKLMMRLSPCGPAVCCGGSQWRLLKNFVDYVGRAAEPGTLLGLHKGAVHENGIGFHGLKQLRVAERKVVEAQLGIDRFLAANGVSYADAGGRDEPCQFVATERVLEVFNHFDLVTGVLQCLQHVARRATTGIVIDHCHADFLPNCLHSTEHNIRAARGRDAGG